MSPNGCHTELAKQHDRETDVTWLDKDKWSSVMTQFMELNRFMLWFAHFRVFAEQHKKFALKTLGDFTSFFFFACFYEPNKCLFEGYSASRHYTRVV